ncbi:hypothetical protein DYBT9623_05353 [Dyadobacter sp. CECT 9623]|uniref:DUF3575 domain-containing protein n=1 Tax=Dyadobacter linearis TaxID=2823330 RepID=A0ABN7REV0_9BACT|nr:hypothetical protein [Dyadobacter sp. CECT 9623]CAG5074666.1 hypothetical protein DYBT9623_05353 [Dyadobacter sp. CECT 9623]
MLVSTLLLFTDINVGTAQSVEDSTRFEIGVDLLSPFSNLRLDRLNSTYGLIFKRAISPTGALRLRTDLGIDYMPSPTIKGTNQPREFSTSFDLGYEKRNRFNRFVHYYGSDLSFRYYKLNSTVLIGISGTSASPYTNQKGRIVDFGISAFTGGKYYIASHISLSIETTALLSYADIFEKSQDFDVNGNALGSAVPTIDTNGITFKIMPISVIYLSYYF